MSRTIRPLLVVCALALLVPVAAQAQSTAPTALDGSPLNIWASPEGSIQVNVDGYTDSEFFPFNGSDPNTGLPAPSQTANDGFGVIVDPQTQPQFFGNYIGGGFPPPEAGPTLTPGDPATISTTWSVTDGSNPLLRITQLLSYQNGSRQFDATWTVQNISDTAHTLRANVGGDLAIRGSDTGIGQLLPGPPRFVGGLNPDVGAAGGFVEQTPWSNFEANQFSTIRSHASDPGVGLDGTIETESVDDGAGVQWDDHYNHGSELQPGETATYKLGWKFYDTLSLSPPESTPEVGDEQTLTARVFDESGNPLNHQTLVYTVAGTNPLAGQINTGNDGVAKIVYVGGQPGHDDVTVFVDTNGNGVREPNEQQSVAKVDWQGPPLPPPVIGQSAGVKPVSGKVKIKLPKGTSPITAKRLGLTGAATKFTTLKNAASIPMGSILDTSRGTVRLLTAGSKPSSQTGLSSYASGDFKSGLFRMTQSRRNPLTTLSMQGGKLKGCNTKIPKGGAARKRSRRLFGNAHGRYRTRGRHSSATVRGTKWSMTDTCSGTLTVVSRGSVTVRDFELRKNKIVRAGHRYFAKARVRKGGHRRLR